MIPEDVVGFGSRLAAQLSRLLGDDLVGAYYVGSIALGGYVAGESDLDIVAVTAASVSHDMKSQIADALWTLTADCPARGLEFTLYRGDAVARPSAEADFEVNVNGGPRMARTVHLDATAEPWFWYVLDRAVAHRSGVTVVGPEPAEVFADIERSTLLDAMTASMRWHRQHEKATLYSVLNATRAWRFAAEDFLGSKLDGAAWARQRWSRPAVIDAAVELRHGRPAELSTAEVDEFLAHVEALCSSAR